MKKINLLIPALVAVTVSPFIGLTSCKEKEPEPTPPVPPGPEPEPEPVPEGNCLTFTALEDVKINGNRRCSKKMEKDYCPDLHYSINDNPGYKYDFPTKPNTKGPTIELKANDTIKLWGNNPKGFSYDPFSMDTYVQNTFDIVGKVNASGNIMSLIDNGLCQEDNIPCDGCFCYIFAGDDIVNAENLILPTKLTDYCFSNMFSDCMELTTAPKLEAQELTSSCYEGMFSWCSSLIAAPDLPATNLTVYCYRDMFSGCDSLVKPPMISAQSLADFCCYCMFEQCSSMNLCTDGQESHKFFTCPDTSGIEHPVSNMFTGTKGEIETPTSGSTYYWVDPS